MFLILKLKIISVLKTTENLSTCCPIKISILFNCLCLNPPPISIFLFCFYCHDTHRRTVHLIEHSKKCLDEGGGQFIVLLQDLRSGVAPFHVGVQGGSCCWTDKIHIQPLSTQHGAHTVGVLNPPSDPDVPPHPAVASNPAVPSNPGVAPNPVPSDPNVASDPDHDVCTLNLLISCWDTLWKCAVILTLHSHAHLNNHFPSFCF